MVKDNQQGARQSNERKTGETQTFSSVFVSILKMCFLRYGTVVKICTHKRENFPTFFFFFYWFCFNPHGPRDFQQLNLRLSLSRCFENMQQKPREDFTLHLLHRFESLEGI